MKQLIASAFTGGVAVGYLVASFVVYQSPQTPVATPVLLTDARAVVSALEPFEQGSSFERASVCVRSRAKDSYSGPSTVGVTLHTSRDSKFESWADTLPDAVRGLTGQSDTIKAALAPFSYQQVKP